MEVLSSIPEMTMTLYVSPDGRIHRHLPSKGKWIALTILAVTMIGLLIVGHQNTSMILNYVGL